MKEKKKSFFMIKALRRSSGQHLEITILQKIRLKTDGVMKDLKKRNIS